MSDGNDDGGDLVIKSDEPYRYVAFCILSFLMLLFIWWWSAFPLLLSQFTHDYVRIGTPPSPNEFMSSRYGWDWVFVFLLVTNYFWFVLLPMAVALRKDLPELADVHLWFSDIYFWINLACFVALSVAWIGFCNTTGIGARYSICNSYFYCGKYFPSPWCPNTNIFTPDVSSMGLSVNAEFYTIWWSCLIFLLLVYMSWSMNFSLRKYRILY